MRVNLVYSREFLPRSCSPLKSQAETGGNPFVNSPQLQLIDLTVILGLTESLSASCTSFLTADRDADKQTCYKIGTVFRVPNGIIKMITGVRTRIVLRIRPTEE
jgi:hypothetical protein